MVLLLIVFILSAAVAFLTLHVLTLKGECRDLYTRLSKVEEHVERNRKAAEAVLNSYVNVNYDEEPYQDVPEVDDGDESAPTEEPDEPSEVDHLISDVSILGGQMDTIYDLHQERLAEIEGLDQRVTALENRVTVLETNPPIGTMSSIIDSAKPKARKTKVKAKAKPAKRGR